MLSLCAWCCREGEPGYLGEREPLDNPEPTHGICARHKTQFLESLPSQSFPDAALLIIVPRANTALYAQLKQIFAAQSAVTVVSERREAERRGVPRPGSCGRRMSGRRIYDGTISALGDFTMVWFTPKVPPATVLPEGASLRSPFHPPSDSVATANISNREVAMGRMDHLKLAMALGFALSLLAGCEQKGTAEKAGEKVDKAMQKAGDKIQESSKEAERKVKEATK